MSGFGFTEAQEMFRREVRNFAQRELMPGAKERTKLDFIPREVRKKIADMGLLGINLPEKYGGQPSDWVSLGIAVEELGRVSAAEGMQPVLPHGILGLVQPNEELYQEWTPQVIRGDKLVAFGVTEPDCGSDAAAMKTRAIRDGDYYILNGEKVPVSMGMQADAFVVFAKTDPTAGAKGVTCFLVPEELPGMTRSRLAHMGWKLIGSASVIMDNVQLPAQYRLGEEGRGFYYAMAAIDIFRLGVALTCLGAAEQSLEETIEYAKQRTAFGRPIAKFEGVSFKIAEHATMIEAARLLCYRALWIRDQGLPNTKEVAMAKWWSPQVAANAIHDFLLIFGHVGYSEEYPLEQRLRDVIGFELGDGTAETQKVVLVRELMGKEFLPY